MRELVLICPEHQAEACSDALLELGVLSVTVEDAEKDTDLEQPLFGEPGEEPPVQAWPTNRIIALLPDGLDPQQLLAQMDDMLETGLVHANWSLRQVPDADWVRLTQSQFPPIQVGDRVWIVPSWHRDGADIPEFGERDAQGREIIRIELDPGLAFGTGSHPTTHLCLEWLADNIQGGETLLDYGCGSGILAIAARKLGVGDTVAIDIDPQAVQSTLDNARSNHVTLRAALPDDLEDGRYDILVANILSNPLKVLAPMLSSRVAPGGRLVLSGVLERQADEVAQAYAQWIDMRVWRTRDGWACLVGQKGDA